MKKKKIVLYTITIFASLLAWLFLSAILIFSLPRVTTLTKRQFGPLEATCMVIGVEDEYNAVHGFPMPSYKNVSNVCYGERQHYYPVGIVVDVLTALVIIGIPTTAVLTILHKKYEIIANR